MSALIAHFADKKWPDKIVALVALFGFIGGIGGCVFGLVRIAGATVQTPGDRLAALQSAQQADHAAIIATQAKEQAHADAINQLAATTKAAPSIEPRVKDIESWVADHKLAVVEKDKQFMLLQLSNATTLQKIDDLRSFIDDRMNAIEADLRAIRGDQVRRQKLEMP